MLSSYALPLPFFPFSCVSPSIGRHPPGGGYKATFENEGGFLVFVPTAQGYVAVPIPLGHLPCFLQCFGSVNNKRHRRSDALLILLLAAIFNLIAHISLSFLQRELLVFFGDEVSVVGFT